MSETIETSEIPIETEDQIISRHKKENRDLIATVTGLKRQANKKTRKDVNKQCQEMEEKLLQKQKDELVAFYKGASGAVDGNGGEKAQDDDDDDEITPEKLLAQLELNAKTESDNDTAAKLDEQPKKGPKRNRQKERLARRDAAIQEVKAQAAKEADLQPDLRALELENIEALCNAKQLKQFDIKPDGHCLFASIADQLKTRHNIDVSIQELRTKAANHIRKDPNTYSPFLFDEETLTIKDIKEYTDKIENTALWGGDMEILALSKEFDCPVTVVMSGRAPLKMNEDGHAAELKLAYYKHSYGLGEHYNSLHDKI